MTWAGGELSFWVMPIYEYECAACEGTFEEMQKITAAPLERCRECGASRVRRLISRTSFQLKGTGWYQTDYAQKAPGKSPSVEEKKSAKSSSEKTKSKDSGTKAASAS